MFERFIRFSQVKRALKEGRLEEALQLLRDPVISRDRRAAELRNKALGRILERARGRKERGDHAPALVDVELVVAAQPGFAGAATLSREIESCLKAQEGRARGRPQHAEAGPGAPRGRRTRCRRGPVPAIDGGGGERRWPGRDAAADCRPPAKPRGMPSQTSRQHWRAGDLAQAQESLARARAQDRDVAAVGRLQVRVQAKLARHYVDRLRAVGSTALPLVLKELGRDVARLPGLLAESSLAAALGDAADALPRWAEGGVPARRGGVSPAVLSGDPRAAHGLR